MPLMISTPKRPRYSAPEFLRALMPAPDAIALGTDAETGEDISLPVKTLTRNISAEAETGQGKTALAQELAFTYPFSPMSLVNLDYIGTGSVDLRADSVRAFQRLWNLNNPGDKIAEDGDYGPATASRLAQTNANGFAKGFRTASRTRRKEPRNEVHISFPGIR